MKLKELIAAMGVILAKQKGLLEKSDPTAEEITQITANETEMARLDGEIETARALETAAANAASRFVKLTAQGSTSPLALPTTSERAYAIPRRSKRIRDQVFLGEGGDERAYHFYKWLSGAVLNQKTGLDFCREHGIPIDIEMKDNTGEINSAGGAIIPQQFIPDIIDLVEKYGVFRAWADIIPMSSDNAIQPRRTGGLTAYPVGAAEAATRSQLGWDNVELTARKWMILSRYNSELGEDAAISLANRFAIEIGRAFAFAEDDAGLNGDGTSSYHGIVGIRTKLKNLSGTVANIAGLALAATGTDASWDSITLANFTDLVALLPQYADSLAAGWICHRTFLWKVMVRLLTTGSGSGTGITPEQLAALGAPTHFLGYPIRVSQVMPKVESASVVPVLFGNIEEGVSFGDRRSMTVAVSEHLNFAEDQTNIRATERFDINVHDVGNASATASLRQPGPIVGMITQA